MRWFLIGALFVVSISLVAQEQPGDVPKPEVERLAAGSGIVWGHVPDCAALRRDWRKGFLARLLFSKDLKPFFEKMAKAYTHGGRGLKNWMKQQLGLEIAELLKGFNRGLLVHLNDIKAQPGMRPQTVGDVVKFLFALEVGEAEPAWKRFVKKLTEFAAPSAKGKQVTDGAKIEWAGGRGIRIYHSFHKGLLLGSFDLDTITQAIKRADKGAAATSVYTEQVKKMLSAAGLKSPTIVVRFGITAFIDALAPAMGPRQDPLKMLKLLGGDRFDLSNVVFAAEPHGEGYREVFIVKFSKEGAKTKTVPTVIPQKLLTPSEDIYLLAFTENEWASQTWKQMLLQMKEQEEMMRQFDPQAKGPYSRVKEMEQALGFRIEDLTKQVGAGAMYVVRPAGGGAFPEGFVVFNLTGNPQTFAQRFDKIMEMFGKKEKQLKKKQFAGHNFWVYEVEERERRTPLGELPWMPIWGVAEGKLLAATSTLTMKRLLKALERPKEPNETLKGFLKRAGGCVSAAYLNLPAVITYLYNTFIPFVMKNKSALQDLKEAGIDLDLLPDAETLASYFPRVFSFARRSGDILYSEVITDKGFGFVCDMMTTLGYVLLSALTYEELNPERAMRRQAQRAQAEVVTALRTLLVYQSMYKMGKEKGRYAKSVDELIKSGIALKSAFALKTHRIRIISADDKTWAAVAEPLPNSPIKRHYYIDHTGVIRYSDTGPADSKSPVFDGSIPPVTKPKAPEPKR